MTSNQTALSSFSGAVPAACPANEAERIQKLLTYKVLDTEAETAYDDLTAIAAQICGTPSAAVSLIDVSRQWFKSTVGLNATETHRDLAFCAHAILKPQVLVIPDARADERFAHNLLVTDPPFIRFYAGAPLITAEGYALGTLCVIDTEPRDLSPLQVKTLEALARQVVGQLEMRLMLQRLNQEAEEKEKARAGLQQLNASLEVRVQQRTEDIRQKNDELEKALVELKQTQAHLIHSEKITALGELVAGVAHEINNPLGFVSGSISHAQGYVTRLLELLAIYRKTYGEQDAVVAEMIEEIDPDFISEDIMKMLGSMKAGTNRMIEIVRSLRNFSRIDKQGFNTADIHAGIDSTLLLLNNRLLMLGQNQQVVSVVKHYGEVPEINCDIGQLNQVFMNLLANAIDAFEQSAVEAERKPTITITTKAFSDCIKISIKDNGAGIPADIADNIFQPFFTTKPTDKGTGLGLSISHKVITQNHKGQIVCQSQVGEGTSSPSRFQTICHDTLWFYSAISLMALFFTFTKPLLS